MATLTPTLTLNSADATSDQLAFSVTDTLSFKAPFQQISQVIIGTSATTIVAATTDVIYLYVRHTGTTDGTTSTSETVDIKTTASTITDNNTDSTPVAFARLAAGEWCFLPYNFEGESNGVQINSSSANIQVEYAFFTKM
jgi:hypothetical protein